MKTYFYAKMASIVAIISSAALLSGCQTSNERPEVYNPQQSKMRPTLVRHRADKKRHTERLEPCKPGQMKPRCALVKPKADNYRHFKRLNY